MHEHVGVHLMGPRQPENNAKGVPFSLPVDITGGSARAMVEQVSSPGPAFSVRTMRLTSPCMRRAASSQPVQTCPHGNLPGRQQNA